MKHWKNLGKRGLALFLVLMMCMTLLPTAAFAVEEETIPCEACEGRGMVESACPDCEGTGKVSVTSECPDCEEPPVCEVCDGKGEVAGEVTADCDICGGTGTVTDPETEELADCKACEGTGKTTEEGLVSCEACADWEEPETCATCGGSRKVTTTEDCAACEGTGTVEHTCTACGGTGTVVKTAEPPEENPVDTEAIAAAVGEVGADLQNLGDRFGAFQEEFFWNLTGDEEDPMADFTAAAAAEFGKEFNVLLAKFKAIPAEVTETEYATTYSELEYALGDLAAAMGGDLNSGINTTAGFVSVDFILQYPNGNKVKLGTASLTSGFAYQISAIYRSAGCNYNWQSDYTENNFYLLDGYYKNGSGSRTTSESTKYTYTSNGSLVAKLKYNTYSCKLDTYMYLDGSNTFINSSTGDAIPSYQRFYFSTYLSPKDMVTPDRNPKATITFEETGPGSGVWNLVLTITAGQFKKVYKGAGVGHAQISGKDMSKATYESNITGATWHDTGNTQTTQYIHAKDITGIQNYPTFTLYYNGNGGTPSKTEDTYSGPGATHSFTPDATATRDNYEFKGWSTQPGENNSGGKVDSSVSVSSNSSKTVYAIWTPIDYTIKYVDGVEDQEVFADQSYTKHYGEATPTYTAPETYTDSAGKEWKFKDWSPIVAATVTCNATYTATWEEVEDDTYNITYELKGGSVSPANPETYSKESDEITLNNPTKSGFIFTGWTGTGLDKLTMIVTIPKGSTGDRTYTAHWETVTKTPSKTEVKVGEEFTYTIHVSNSTEYGFFVNITDKLDPKLEVPWYDECNCWGTSDGAQYDEDTHTETWTNLSVPANGGKSVTVTVIAKEAGKINNTVTVTPVGGAPVDATAPEVTAKPELTITKSAPKGVKVGGDLEYTITATNTGKVDATGVVVTDTLPEQLAGYITKSDPGYNLNNGVYSWNLGTIPAGQSKEIKFTAPGKSGVTGSAKNTAYVTADGITDPVPSNEVETKLFKLTPTKEHEKPISVAGSTATIKYTVTIKNESGFDLYGLDIIDTLKKPEITSGTASLKLKPTSLTTTDESVKVMELEGEFGLFVEKNENETHIFHALDRSTVFKNGSTVTLKYDVIVTNTGKDQLVLRVSNVAKGGCWTTDGTEAQMFRMMARSGSGYDAESEEVGDNAGVGDDATVVIPPAQGHKVTIKYVDENDSPISGKSEDVFYADKDGAYNVTDKIAAPSGYAIISINGKTEGTTDTDVTITVKCGVDAYKPTSPTDPTKKDGGDGIPDKYQAVVTYKVSGGTWGGTDKADKEYVFTLYEKDDTTGEWKELTTKPTLGTTVPTGMTPDGTHTADGAEWKDSTPKSMTQVTGNVTYTYSFSPKGAEVTYPEFKDEDGNGKPDKLPEEKTDSVGAGVKIIVDPNGGTWEHGEPAVWTEEGKTFTHTAAEGERISLAPNPTRTEGTDHYVFMGWKRTDGTEPDGTKTITYTAQWQLDNGVDPMDDKNGTNEPGDGIPDMWQAKVTFTSNDGSAVLSGAPTETYVTLYKDGEYATAADGGTGKLAASQIPGVSPKDASYSEPVTWTVDGSTVAAPGTDTAITKDVTFNVEYTLIGSYPAVTVKYVDEDDNSVLRTDNVTVGDDGSYTATVTIPDGYVQSEIDKATSGTVNHGGEAVVITVKCAKDTLVDPTVTDPDPAKPGDGVADKYQVTVRYTSENTMQGTVTGATTKVFTLGTAPNYATSGTITPGTSGITLTGIGRYVFSSWNANPNAALNVTGGGTYNFIARFVIPTTGGGGTGGGGGGGTGGGGGGGTGGTTINDTEVPLAGDLQLNKQDHFAYIKGYQDGTVRPNNPLTRAQVATIFYRLLDETSRIIYFQETNDFTDVADDFWACKAISTLTNAGIITGFQDGTFRPNAYITRAQFAAIAARFDNVVPGLENPFSDVSEDYWARDLIAYAASKGWIEGESGKFRPLENITRVEAMDFINNVLDRHVDEKGILAGATTFTDVPVTDPNYYVVEEATNSHDYTRRSEGQLMENWTKLNPDPVWEE